MRNSNDSMYLQQRTGLLRWVRSGEPMVWGNAAAVSVSLISVVGLLLLLAVRGFGHFWAADMVQAELQQGDTTLPVLGQIVEQEQVSGEQLRAAGVELAGAGPFFQRTLLKQGNREFLGSDFIWLLDEQLVAVERPPAAMVLERLEWGNFYGFLHTVEKDATTIADARQDETKAWAALHDLLAASQETRSKIEDIERTDIGRINHGMDQLRLQARTLELEGLASPLALAAIAEQRAELDAEYGLLQEQLVSLYQILSRDSLSARIADGTEVVLPLSQIVRAYRPNAMSVLQKLGLYMERLWEFLSAEPREANTEGGVYPAIFGTVIMVLLMSVIVTPFGVVAAVYLREYAKQGLMTRTVRIAVNNLAGVPSIVYGVFGLGFFVYFLGGNIDQLFFPEALPAPTFGTPGILWSALTLAILTVPVVIVSTEEGLTRIPRAIREGSLALGATKAETLWRTVLPMATPAMMTGLILSIARAAGEVAPLMMVGVVKLAPSLPMDGNFPFLHVDRKFMHLGFHIYDVGFQSPNVEAARPLVYATALLLVILIVTLNIAAIRVRNQLREKYNAADG